MHRKDFLARFAALAIGAGCTPVSELVAPAQKTYDVGIVGAGISGLYLADLLGRQGHRVTILEAKPRAGGRIVHNTTFHATPLDVGAQWIHGKNVFRELVRDNKVAVYRDRKNANIKVHYKGELRDSFPAEFYRFLEVINAETPLTKDVSVLEFARRFSKDADFLRLVEHLMTDTATKADHFSCNELAEMTSHLTPTDYQFRSMTMAEFVDRVYVRKLRKNLVYNFPVSRIDYSRRNVVVYNRENQSYAFEKLVVTVPITALRRPGIAFIPALSETKRKALDFIGMDKGLKIFLKFSKKFFQYPVFNAKATGYYIDPTKKEAPGSPLLATLVMGKRADAYYERPEAALSRYLADLDSLYNGQASKYFAGMLVQDWGAEPYINGVYSYTKPGGQAARAIASEPIGNKIYFAGEAMNTQHNFGTVHGAIESALAVLSALNQAK